MCHCFYFFTSTVAKQLENIYVFLDDRNSGGPPNPPSDPSQDLEDSTNHGADPGTITKDIGDLRTRRLDPVINVAQMQATAPPVVDQRKTATPVRRGQKRKNTSSDENEEEEAGNPNRNTVMSPASSCHSTTGTHPIISAPESTGNSPKKIDDTGKTC